MPESTAEIRYFGPAAMFDGPRWSHADLEDFRFDERTGFFREPPSLPAGDLNERTRYLYCAASEAETLDAAAGEGDHLGFDVLSDQGSCIRRTLDEGHAIEGLNRYGLFFRYDDAKRFAKRFGPQADAWSIFWMTVVRWRNVAPLTLDRVAFREVIETPEGRAQSSPVEERFWSAAVRLEAPSVRLDLPDQKWISLGLAWESSKCTRLDANATLRWTELRRYEDELRALLAHPKAAALRALSIGITENDRPPGAHALLEYDGLIDALTSAPRPALETLTIGARDAPYDTVIRSLEALWAVAPSLRALTLAGEFVEDIGPLRAPSLETLRVWCDGVSAETVERIIGAQAPKLTELALRFCDGTSGTRTELSLLRPLYDGERFPRLTHLAALNAPTGGEELSSLLASAMVKQLTTLDLSGSCFDDEDGERLLEGLAKLAKLEKLALRVTNFSREMRERLRALPIKSVELDGFERVHRKTARSMPPHWRKDTAIDGSSVDVRTKTLDVLDDFERFAMSTEPIDRARAERAAAQAYQAVRATWTGRVLYVPSVDVLCAVASTLERLATEGASAVRAEKKRFGALVSEEVWKQIEALPPDACAWRNLAEMPVRFTRHRLDRAGVTLAALTRNSAEGDLRILAEHHPHPSTPRSGDLGPVYRFWGAQSYVDLASFYALRSIEKVAPLVSRVEGLLSLAEHAHIVSAREGICVFCERPTKIKKVNPWELQMLYADGAKQRVMLDPMAVR